MSTSSGSTESLSSQFHSSFTLVTRTVSFLRDVGSPKFDSPFPKQVPPYSQLSYQLLWGRA